MTRASATGRQERLRLGLPRTGERTFATKPEADLYLGDMQGAVHRGTWADPRLRGQTLASFADEWLAHRPLAVRTKDLCSDLLQLHVKPLLGKMPLGSITPAETRRWHMAAALIHQHAAETGEAMLAAQLTLDPSEPMTTEDAVS